MQISKTELTDRNIRKKRFRIQLSYYLDSQQHCASSGLTEKWHKCKTITEVKDSHLVLWLGSHFTILDNIFIKSKHLHHDT